MKVNVRLISWTYEKKITWFLKTIFQSFSAKRIKKYFIRELLKKIKCSKFKTIFCCTVHMLQAINECLKLKQDKNACITLVGQNNRFIRNFEKIDHTCMQHRGNHNFQHIIFKSLGINLHSLETFWYLMSFNSEFIEDLKMSLVLDTMYIFISWWNKENWLLTIFNRLFCRRATLLGRKVSVKQAVLWRANRLSGGRGWTGMWWTNTGADRCADRSSDKRSVRRTDRRADRRSARSADRRSHWKSDKWAFRLSDRRERTGVQHPVWGA